MDADLLPVYERVMQASRPEDTFKPMGLVLPPRLLEQHLAPEMDVMREVLTVERYHSADDRDAAQVARSKLERLYADALVRAGKGHYALDDYTMLLPPSSGRSIQVGDTRYSVGEKLHVGEHASLYKGRMEIDGGSAGVVIRVANTPDDNPYLFREIRMLDLLHQQDVGYWRNVPFMLGRFMAGERVGIVERYFDGVSLTTIRANRLHRDGLDQRHVFWIMDRMLGLLAYAHKLGIVHGRIEPDRILVRPSNHNGFLTGWGHAVYRPAVTGERIHAVGGIFEAPEVRDSGKVGPWTDIYCLGKTLIWLVGGNTDTDEMPDTVEPKAQRFLQNMVRRSPKARPRDALQLYDAQNLLKDSLWERRFIHLDLA